LNTDYTEPQPSRGSRFEGEGPPLIKYERVQISGLMRRYLLKFLTYNYKKGLKI